MQICTLDQLNGSLSLVNQLQNDVASCCLSSRLQKEGLIFLIQIIFVSFEEKKPQVSMVHGTVKLDSYGFPPSTGPLRRGTRAWRDSELMRYLTSSLT